MQTEFPTLGVSVEDVPTGAPKLKPRYTVDEYLAKERAAFERHTYLDGEIIAMAGESDRHGIISVNIIVALGNQLKGKPCQVRTKDTKVRKRPDSGKWAGQERALLLSRYLDRLRRTRIS